MKKRGFGCVYRPKDSKFYWIKYYRYGKPIYESTRSKDKTFAQRLLKIRAGAIAEGRHPGVDVLKTTIHDLVKLYRADMEANKRRAVKEAKRHAELIDDYFGRLRASDLTTSHLTSYRTKRQGKGVKDSTINRELAALKRMFNLGLRHDPPLVVRVPYIALVPEDNVRQGFFEREEFDALRGALPDHLKVAATIGYYTGLREGEILALRWEQVDLAHGTIRLETGTTKNKEGREVPLIPALRETLEQWRLKTLARRPKCPWVIQYAGRRIARISTGWRNACEEAGLTGKLFHDLRRTGVRNLIRAGVPEAVAMRISGHKTRAVFDRYNIVSHADLVDAAARLARYDAETAKRLKKRLKSE